MGRPPKGASRSRYAGADCSSSPAPASGCPQFRSRATGEEADRLNEAQLRLEAAARLVAAVVLGEVEPGDVMPAVLGLIDRAAEEVRRA